jgi:hypothetical protein
MLRQLFSPGVQRAGAGAGQVAGGSGEFPRSLGLGGRDPDEYPFPEWGVADRQVSDVRAGLVGTGLLGHRIHPCVGADEREHLLDRGERRPALAERPASGDDGPVPVFRQRFGDRSTVARARSVSDTDSRRANGCRAQTGSTRWRCPG